MKAFFRRQYETVTRSRYRWPRIVMGVLLVLSGLIGFLPILGFWMVPLGLALLAIDFPAVRRFNVRALAVARHGRERVTAWWRERKRRRSA